MILQKWNYKLHKYESFDSPAKNPVLYEEDLDTLKDCANCGKEEKFGEMYTSRTIHTNIGFGYCVCEKCYEQEFEEERSAKLEDPKKEYLIKEKSL